MDGNYEVSGELAQRLQPQANGPVEEAPPTLQFERTREIELPWVDLIDASKTDTDQAATEAAASIQHHFEESWGFDADDDFSVLLEAGWIMGPDGRGPDADPDEGAGVFVPLTSPPASKADGEDTATEPTSPKVFADGVFVRHASGRIYRLHGEGSLLISDFRERGLYQQAWASVRTIELVGEAADTTDRTTQVESIDLRAPFIESHYRELTTERDMAKTILDKSKEIFDHRLNSTSNPLLDHSTLEEIQDPYRAASLRLDRTERQLRTLVRKASQMGYVLFVEPIRVDPNAAEPASNSGDGDDVAADSLPARPVLIPETRGSDGNIAQPEVLGEFGVLYRRTVERRTYTPTITVNNIMTWFHHYRATGRAQLPAEEFHVDSLVQVDTTREPHIERIAELRDEGYLVYVCDLRDSGYFTSDGTPLELVMRQCNLDEERRVRTVVFLPSYDFRLTGDRVLTGYTVFKRPNVGTTPVAFPQLSMVESFTYKTAWKNTEIGELVKAVNLAPGERRTITVSRSFEHETTESTTSSSVFDLASNESTDLATEMEKTARNETNIADQQSANASASVSGSLFGVGANATAAGSTSREKSVNTVGTDMAKAAHKAARSVNEQRKEEVSTSSTSRTTINRSDTSVSEIHNINSGRTLNLMFYRLYNRYVGKLFLEDLHVRVRSGYEVIAGSGVFGTQTYSISELDLVIDELLETPLPVDLSGAVRWQFKLAALQALTKLVTEYYNLEGVDDAGSAHLKGDGLALSRVFTFGTSLDDVSGAILNALPFGSQGKGSDGDKGASPGTEEEYGRLLAELIAELAPTRPTGRPVNATDLVVASGGLYLDAQVGANPSTEPYSEKMRDAELMMRHASVQAVHAQSARDVALASYVARQELGAGEPRVLHARLDGELLVMVLTQPLAEGDWELFEGRDPVGGSSIVDSSRILVTHHFDGPMPAWVTAGEFAGLRLVERATQAAITMSRVLALPA